MTPGSSSNRKISRFQRYEKIDHPGVVLMPSLQVLNLSQTLPQNSGSSNMLVSNCIFRRKVHLLRRYFTGTFEVHFEI